LISNGLKYTVEGHVQITAEKYNQSDIKIQILDTGIGIDEKDL
jgi:signal transduction histidine kinase